MKQDLPGLQGLLAFAQRGQRALSRGFTLIELMMVVAIVAVISAVAIPTYTDYVVKARRAEAKAVLMRAALWMERNQASAFSYAVDGAGVVLNDTTLANVGLGRSPESGNVIWYAITLDTPALPASFQIRATAQGGQATSDAKCAVLIINHLGQRGRLNGGTAEFTQQPARDCWAQ